MVARQIDDQVSEAVMDHKSASSLLMWFEGKGSSKVCVALAPGRSADPLPLSRSSFTCSSPLFTCYLPF